MGTSVIGSTRDFGSLSIGSNPMFPARRNVSGFIFKEIQLIRRISTLLIAGLFSTLGLVSLNSPANASPIFDSGWQLASTTSTVDCYSVTFAHPGAGWQADPCATVIFTRKGCITCDPYVRLAQSIDFFWTAGGGDTHITAVRQVARISDLDGSFSSLQVNWAVEKFYNGGTTLSSCDLVCDHTTGDDLLVQTLGDPGVGCGSVHSHTAGDEVYNHVQYSARFTSGSLATFEGNGSPPGADITISNPTYWYFAPRSTC